ncbi:hypothetical protein, variant [Verruconis gallopava]|nr:hypothetical protein, variant [Verruconis gallopava]KIV98436.1 hypothetical protein, variant [Verruconis gallopava]
MCKESIRERMIRALGIHVPGGTWRLLAIILAVINVKNLPLVWHYRLFRPLIYHLFLQRIELKPEDLFKPVVHMTHTPMTEMDYNFHKSNSTYFTDLDISRTHLATAILRKGIRGIKGEEGETFSLRNTPRAAGHKIREPTSAFNTNPKQCSAMGARVMTEEDWYQKVTQPGPLFVALGAVTCHFHKEIRPYKKYEVWTRLLTWDRKWLYIVSHFVERGAFKPRGYRLQPGWKASQKIEHLTEDDKAKLRNKIFASSIAKYVVKKGRLTIPPELVLERSQMLPVRPEGTPILGGWTPSTSSNTTPESIGTLSPDLERSITFNNIAHGGFAGSRQAILEQTLFPNINDMSNADCGWTWEIMQKERLKGLSLAEAFDSLDNLKDTFDLNAEEAIGRYSDLIFNF